MNCKKCGNALKPEDKVCSNCGEAVDSSIDIQEGKNINNKKINKAVIVILILLVLFIIGFMVYASIIKYTNNSNEPNTPNNPDSSLDNNIEDNNDQDNKEVNYVLNAELANIYEPITDTKIKIEDNVLTPAIIMEIDENKNVGYYFEDCGQNCDPTIININGEQAKYITYLSRGYAGAFGYIILTEEGNIYEGDITNSSGVSAAKVVASDHKFVNIVRGGYRVEANGKSGSILGVTSDNSYYNIIYCPNTKGGDYLSYIMYYDYSDIQNMPTEYILIYNDGSISYFKNVTSYGGGPYCDNYDYYQYIVNANNEKIQAQVVFYKDGFYILGTDGYLYKLTEKKIGNNYIAELYNSNKIEKYSYEQKGYLIKSITVEYNDGKKLIFDNLQSRGTQIVMIEKN